MKLTYLITKDQGQVWEMFRRMCFNIYAHNRDDHSKNFSYLYDETKRKWLLTPAYDLTYSSSLGGEHATCVDGNGKDPGKKEILRVAQRAGLNKAEAGRVAEGIRQIVEANLGKM